MFNPHYITIAFIIPLPGFIAKWRAARSAARVRAFHPIADALIVAMAEQHANDGRA